MKVVSQESHTNSSEVL